MADSGVRWHDSAVVAGARIRYLLSAACVVLAASCAVASGAPASVAAPAPEVTVIGDSIMTGVAWNASALAILAQGADLQMEVGVCRRVEGVSCPFEGAEVPTLVDLVPQLGSSIAKTVIVEVGYNDPGDVFAAEVEDAMHVLIHAGVTRVLWVNMREAEGQFPAMNQILVSAAARYPQLTVIDWNAYSTGHPEWFQTDAMHLLLGGGEGLATLLHRALETLVLAPAPPRVTVFPVPAPLDPPLVLPAAVLPAAKVGRPYAFELPVTGGTAPFKWRVTSGPLPRGLHLLARGLLTGTPRRPSRTVIAFQTTDSLGQTAKQQLRLVIGRSTTGRS
jgi:hypothetical protein